MRRSDPARARPIDLGGWALVAWVTVCGALYARMYLECKAPALLAALRAYVPGR